jgi:hypothetical protein
VSERQNRYARTIYTQKGENGRTWGVFCKTQGMCMTGVEMAANALLYAFNQRECVKRLAGHLLLPI